MMYPMLNNRRDEILVVARVLLMTLFVMSGFFKLTGFSDTAAYMASAGLPFPSLTAAAVTALELGGGIALMLGVYTRTLALLFALYALATAFIGHRYWAMTGSDHMTNLYGFYKNVSIVGAFLLLSATGGGRHSISREASLDTRQSHGAVGDRAL